MVLDAVGGPATGRSLEVPPEGLRLGRSGALACDDTVSHEHADLSWTSDGDLAMRDLQSTNGTYVNGTRITGWAVLRPGDEIRLGATVLAVRWEDSVPVNPGKPAGTQIHFEGGQHAEKGGVIAGEIHGGVRTFVDSSGLAALMQARGFALFLVIFGTGLALAGFASFGYPIIRFITEGAQSFGDPSAQPTLHAMPWLPLGAILFFAGAVCMTAGLFASFRRQD